MSERYQINIAARRTGLSTHVVRVWERRYGAIRPERTHSKRRLYSPEDISRLTLLRRVTMQGHSIGRVETLSDEQLQQLAVQETLSKRRSRELPNRAVTVRTDADQYRSLCLTDIENLDSSAFEERLNQASVDLGQSQVLEQLLIPILQEIGERWRNGTFRVVHEHLASAVIRGYLSHVTQTYAWNPAAPHLVVTTPVGYMHEFGALIASAVASSEGWKVTYLGPNLPAEEIALIVRQTEASAIALGMNFSAQEQAAADDLRRLMAVLPAHVTVLVGGAGAELRRQEFQQLNIEVIENLAQLRERLSALITLPRHRVSET